MARREFDSKAKARAVLKKLRPEELADKKTCQAAVKAAKIDLSLIAIGKLAKELRNGHAGTNGAPYPQDVLVRRVKAVKRAINACGSIEQLEATISFIKTVRAIQ